MDAVTTTPQPINEPVRTADDVVDLGGVGPQLGQFRLQSGTLGATRGEGAHRLVDRLGRGGDGVHGTSYGGVAAREPPLELDVVNTRTEPRY